jgi:hypothetical protein
MWTKATLPTWHDTRLLVHRMARHDWTPVLSIVLRSVRRAAITVGVGVGLLSGCTAAEEEAALDEGALVNLPETSVKQQALNNCWAYATAGWIESMRMAQGNPGGNVAEVYLNYWALFDQIHDKSRKETYPWIGFTLGDEPYNAVFEGGRPGLAYELILRYGIVEEADFLPGVDGTPARAKLLHDALAKMNKSLASGALKSEAARGDAALVRDELNRAFNLPARVVTYLNATFGPKEPRRLDGPQGDIPKSSPVRRARDIGVTSIGHATNLEQVIGVRAGDGRDADYREGAEAWSYKPYPCIRPGTHPDPAQLASERRAFVRRIQRTLHAGTPLVLDWWTDQTIQTAQGEFVTARHSGADQGGIGLHASLITDYQVATPSFGILPAGGRAATPAEREDALANGATVQFLRIKNSWGLNSAAEPGYNDLYMSYLSDTIFNPAHSSVLPKYECEDQPALRGAMFPNGVSGDTP